MEKRILIRRLDPLAASALPACSSCTAENEKVVATVNGVPITVADIQGEVAGYAKNNPVKRRTVDDQLKVMIKQKLLVQEAVKMGLSEDKRFAKTIMAFWEQTIIRNLIEAKTGELTGKIFVTDHEIANEYEKMKYRPRVRAIRGVRTKQDAAKIVYQMRRGKHIAGEEIIGPLFYEDVKGSPLANAFDMKRGQIGTFAAAGEYIVICVIDRESIPLPPLQELSKRIRESILLQKKKKMLAEWIATVKNAAKVQIDEKELRRMAMNEKPSYAGYPSQMRKLTISRAGRHK